MPAQSITEQLRNHLLCSHYCPDPGHCCRMFYLSFSHSVWKKNWRRQARAFLKEKNLGFIKPLCQGAGEWTDPETGKIYVQYLCTCTRLDPGTGRCADYANRPSFCRSYTPFADGICALGIWKEC